MTYFWVKTRDENPNPEEKILQMNNIIHLKINNIPSAVVINNTSKDDFLAMEVLGCGCHCISVG